MTETVGDTRVPVLVCDSVDNILLDGLEMSGFEIEYSPKISKEELSSKIGSYRVVVVRSRTKIDSSVINAAGNLRIIARAGIGTDNIDIETAVSKGIKVVTAAGSSTQSVVELNLALAIDLARNIPELSSLVKNGEYRKDIGVELGGRTAGIIGFGRIGYETARILRALGVNVIAYDIVRNEEAMDEIGGKYVDLDQLLKASDIIFVLVTLNGSSNRLLGEREFSIINKGAFLVNTSRAEAIDGVELLKALKDGRVAGYATDVTWNEPPKEEYENEMMRLNNVIVTPHIGAQTVEAQKRVAIATLENIKKAIGEIL